jgi:hypothetical protein
MTGGGAVDSLLLVLLLARLVSVCELFSLREGAIEGNGPRRRLFLLLNGFGPVRVQAIRLLIKHQYAVSAENLLCLFATCFLLTYCARNMPPFKLRSYRRKADVSNQKEGNM